MTQENGQSQWSVEKQPRATDPVILNDFAQAFARRLRKRARVFRSGDQLASARRGRFHKHEQPRRLSGGGDVSLHILASVTAYVEAEDEVRP